MKSDFKPTTNDDANSFLSDNFLALILGMLLDQQIPIERAFLAPYLLKQRLGHFDLKKLAKMPGDKLVEVFVQKPALHRYPADMARRFHKIVNIINSEYNADPEAFLKTTTAEELFNRILSLPGFSEHKAKIFIALLGKRFGIRPRNWQKVSAPFSEKDSYLSAADVTSTQALEKVRLNKKLMKITQ